MQLKSLIKLALLSATFLYVEGAQENLESKIKKNESLIESLQKTLDDMQASGEPSERIKSLQEHIDSVIADQNKLLEDKAKTESEMISSPASIEDKTTKSISNSTGINEETIRRIVREELAKMHQEHKKTINPGDNPYESKHVVTEAERSATEKAESGAPALPEAVSPALAQYQQALALYNKGSYKEAGANFGRIIKTYPKDPIVAKALVHLAFSLEKQNDLESATIVCESALSKKIDNLHKCDCHIIRLKNAKAKNNDKEFESIKKTLKDSVLTEEQKKQFEEIISLPAKKTKTETKSVKKAANG